MSFRFKSLCFGQIGQNCKYFENSFNPTNTVKISAQDSNGLALEALSKLNRDDEGWTANTILSSGYDIQDQIKINASYTSEKQAYINVASSQNWRKDIVLSLLARTKPITIIPSAAYQNQAFALVATADAMSNHLTVTGGSSISSLGFGALLRMNYKNMGVTHAIAKLEYKISEDFVLHSAVKEFGKNIDFSLWTKLSPSISISLQASIKVPTKKTQFQGVLSSSINKKTKFSAGFHSSGLVGLSISRQVYDHVELSFTGLFDVFQATDLTAHKFGVGLNINTLY
ncbi:hypothetical protein M0812_18536 [Anaeramoeba flamelloides]|uniref:Uncharacterized protein n=1 Tax=Anaeramoeba flamelloides TaxID=1746091 RepID=A0AAV7Z2Z8_9EUKA|nr:hypothetical protein M0812_18536 [Anaeramoeba flamelloides]